MSFVFEIAKLRVSQKKKTIFNRHSDKSQVFSYNNANYVSQLIKTQ